MNAPLPTMPASPRLESPPVPGSSLSTISRLLHEEEPTRWIRLLDQFRYWRWRAHERMRGPVKRLLDIGLASFGLLLGSPIVAAIALAIKLDDGGPILYRQVRVARSGRLFLCLKFRSMRVDADRLRDALVQAQGASGGVRFKSRHDPRITRVGRLLRRTSLDEFPQLWNVLRGEMSLVGPRPPIPPEVANYRAREWRRLDVDAGLTCIWQVSGRSCIPFRQQVEMDLAYIQHESVGLDLKLIAKTIPAVISGRGAW